MPPEPIDNTELPEPVAPAPVPTVASGPLPQPALPNYAASPLPAPVAMTRPEPDLSTLRARKARAAKKIGKVGYRMFIISSLLLACLGGALFFVSIRHFGYIALSAALIMSMLAIWYHQDLDLLPATGSKLDDRLSGAVINLLNKKSGLTPKSVWNSLSNHWQVIFLTNHFLLHSNTIGDLLSDDVADMKPVWQKALQLADETGCEVVEPGHVAASLMMNSANVHSLLTQMKLSVGDMQAVALWLGRILELQRADKPFFGGIGRDWANGFTPQLNQFGNNISLAIERGGGHYGSLTKSPGVTAIKNAFAQGAAAIALIGPVGIGKTSHINALAQVLLAEKNDRNLEHRQIVSLNPALIISSAGRPGQLENIVLTLLQETAHAGHIILFLDDAQLFFGSGPGSFDASQILLPVVQSRAVQLIFAMTPNDYQALKTNSSAFAALLTPVMLNELDEPAVMRVLEDTALGLEHRHKVMISYEALHEAYRLSGRYEQDIAYPGKAIQLLEQSLPHAEQTLVTARSIQKAIEQTHGVKTGSAAPAEANALLNLEDEIHKRMINQTRAVTVVSNALRRSRAGVANQSRPIGSFLFLGPTGVGKTELAKAIAATYFGSEASMIRLDMSEYQQAEDANRLLSDGGGQTMSLIMAVREQPFSVILLDEIEKTHPNILNLLLQLLDEGRLTDMTGRAASFKDCIIIATSNAGSQDIRERVGRGETLESFESEFVDELIKSNQFKPELLNRFDEIVLFRPLNSEELAQVVRLMMNGVNRTIATQNISVELTEAAVQQIVAKGYDARLGARPMRRMLQRTVEDELANRILRGVANPGDHIILDVTDLTI